MEKYKLVFKSGDVNEDECTYIKNKIDSNIDQEYSITRIDVFEITKEKSSSHTKQIEFNIEISMKEDKIERIMRKIFNENTKNISIIYSTKELLVDTNSILDYMTGGD